MTAARWRRKLSIQERFEEFDAAHPDVYVLFRRFALELIAVGRRRIGAKLLIERIRWHYVTSSAGSGEFKINNVFSSRYARKLIAERPEFADVFEVRQLQAP